jgi:hypothetical protein
MKHYKRLEEHRRLKSIFKFVNESTATDIASRCRDNEHVKSRAIFCILARQETGATFEMIGEMINRTHATVIHNLSLKDWVFEDERYKKLYDTYYEGLPLKDLSRKTLLKMIHALNDELKKPQQMPSWYFEWKSLDKQSRDEIDERIATIIRFKKPTHKIK